MGGRITSKSRGHDISSPAFSPGWTRRKEGKAPKGHSKASHSGKWVYLAGPNRKGSQILMLQAIWPLVSSGLATSQSFQPFLMDALGWTRAWGTLYQSWAPMENKWR